MQRLGNAVAHVHGEGLRLSPAVHANRTGVPGDGAAFQVLHRDGVKRIPHHHRQAHQLIGLAQRIPGVHHVRYFHKSDHRAFNHVLQGAVGQDAHGVELAGLGLHRGFFGLQGLEHRLRVGHQAGVVHQVGDDVAHRAAHVAQDQIDDLGGSRREAQDTQVVVYEHGANAGAGQQVVHVVVGAGQVGHFGLQLGVDRGHLFVDRLQFFLGGFQLLVGGLQLFVDRLHFLVGRLELFVGGLQLLVGRVQVLFFGAQLVGEFSNLGAGVCCAAGCSAGRFAHRLAQQRCWPGGCRRRFFQHHDVQRRLQ